MPGESEVTNFDDFLMFASHKNIFWFYVPMHYLRPVHVGQTPKNLVDDWAKHFRSYSLLRDFKYLEQIVLNVLEHQAYHTFLVLECLLKLHYVLMAKVA